MKSERRPAEPPRQPLLPELARAAAAVGVATAFSMLTHGVLDIANHVMVYLLAIMVVALRGNRAAALFAATLSVAAFDFTMVPPRFTFAVADVRYLATFVTMLVVGAVISTLTVRIREQAEAARLKELRTASLYRLTRDLAKAGSAAEIARAATRSIEQVFEGGCVLLLPGPAGVPEPVAGVAYAYDLDETELGAARWAFAHKEPAGLATATLPAAKALYLPLSTKDATLGVVGLKPADAWKVESPEQRQLLATFCRQAAVSLENAVLAEEARDAERRAEREELRNSLLSSVSHDLRTPLAAITGAATTLLGEELPGRETRRELLETIAEEATRLNRLVGNLLDMTRLESGDLELKRDWIPLEEVVGAALARCETLLLDRPVTADVPEDLPLVPVDALLVEQALLNLLENAAKHTPPGTAVEVAARAEAGGVALEVRDRGPGLPPGAEQQVFEKFFRAKGPSAPAGTGLGLAIVRGVALAHGGSVSAESRPGGGAVFRIRLPIVGAPPPVEREEPVAS